MSHAFRSRLCPQGRNLGIFNIFAMVFCCIFQANNFQSLPKIEHEQRTKKITVRNWRQKRVQNSFEMRFAAFFVHRFDVSDFIALFFSGKWQKGHRFLGKERISHDWGAETEAEFLGEGGCVSDRRYFANKLVGMRRAQINLPIKFAVQKKTIKSTINLGTPLPLQQFPHMGCSHPQPSSQQLANQLQAELEKIKTSESQILDQWKSGVILLNDGKFPDVCNFSTQVYRSQGEALQQTKKVLDQQLDPQSSTFKFVYEYFQTILKNLINYTHGQMTYSKGTYLGSSGKTVVKIHYYLRRLNVSAQLLNTCSNHDIISYGYALTPINEKLSYHKIATIVEMMNIPPKAQKDIINGLWKDYTHSLSTIELQKLKQQEELIKSIQNPFDD